MGLTPGFFCGVALPWGQEAKMAKHIDGQDVLAKETLDKLRVFTQLLARQAARQTLENPSTSTLSRHGHIRSPGVSVALGTATSS